MKNSRKRSPRSFRPFTFSRPYASISIIRFLACSSSCCWAFSCCSITRSRLSSRLSGSSSRQSSTAQQAAPRPPALIMIVLTWRCGSGKRLYDAAVQVQVQVQAQMPRLGGSVRGQKGMSGYQDYAAAEKAPCPSAGASHHEG